MRWTKVGLGTAKFFCENILDIILCQLTSIKIKALLRQILMAKKGKKRERVKYKNLIISRIFFGKTKSIFGNFFYFDSKNKNSGHKI